MIIGYFGRQRSGKTTFLANYVRKNDRRKKINAFCRRFFRFKKDFLRTYSEIYSTDYIRGAIKIRPQDVGLFLPKENSLFLFPDAGTYFNNRRSKSIPNYTIDFFSDCSHMGIDIIWDSQTVNVDKVLRERSWMLYIVRRFFHWSFTQCIRFKIDILNETKKPDDIYTKPGFLFQFLDLLLHRNYILYRPFVYDYFDSYSIDLNRYALKDDSRYDYYLDNGIRHSWLKKMMPAIKSFLTVLFWILAVVFVLSRIFG